MSALSRPLTLEPSMSDITIGRARPNFLQFLGRFENGELVERLTRELEEIVAAQEQVAQDFGMQATKGTLELKITFSRKKGTYEIVIESKVKKPKGPPSAEVMWATPENNLVPENPRQQKLAFGEIVKRRGGGSDA